jgi:hypothetical protein
VTAQETEQGRRWAEAKIKALTGGDPISARFMRQDFFYFHAAIQTGLEQYDPDSGLMPMGYGDAGRR